MKMLYIASVFTLLTLFAFCSEEKTFKTFYLDAIASINVEDWGSSIESLKNAVHIQPNNIDASQLLGMICRILYTPI